MNITPDTVRVIREVYRLTLEDMATMLDTSIAGVWRIEHYERELTPDMIAKIRLEFELTTPEKLARIYEIHRETDIKRSVRDRPVFNTVTNN